MKLVLVVLVAALLALIGVLMHACDVPPPTYADITHDAQMRCLHTNGDGAWRGSNGMTLDEFCHAVGSYAAIRQEQADHPELF